MIRFEILLPLFYNDGRPIEPEKFLATDDEIVQAFGATSTDQVTVRGKWKYQSIVYSDQLIRVRRIVRPGRPSVSLPARRRAGPRKRDPAAVQARGFIEREPARYSCILKFFAKTFDCHRENAG